MLCIEDSAVNQVLMQGMLSKRPGLRLLFASLPETGLPRAARARPDLVLLDTSSGPASTGYEVLRRLRAQPSTRAIPVVAVSANATQTDMDAAQAARVADCVTKPLDLSRLPVVPGRLLAR